MELEYGRAGTLRELNMRFGVLETYAGKDVVVEYEGIDDGANRVEADLLLSNSHLFRDKDGYEFPFPQREVRLLET